VRHFILLLSLLLASIAAHSEVLGLRAEGGIWKFTPSGTLRDNASVLNTVDIKDDLHIKDESKDQFFIYLRHPVPVNPNVRVGHTSMPWAGSGVATRQFDYGGSTYLVSDSLNSSIDLSHTDIGLYYNLWDTFVTFDLGVNAKIFDGKATISSASATDTATIKGTVPMLYVALAIPFPGTGFDIAGDFSSISAGGDKVTDVYARIRYEITSNFGVEGGYRAFSLKYSDANTYADIKAKGSFINLFLHF
jgi:outer membrane protein